MPQTILQAVNKLGLSAALVLLASMQSYAGDILIVIDGVRAKAPLHAALVSGHEQQWPQQPLHSISSDSTTLHFAEVPPGHYAVQVFQDLNGNAELDQSRRGLPQEPVGFSGNPSLFNGKPSPAKAMFEHGSTDTQLSIRLRQSNRPD